MSHQGSVNSYMEMAFKAAQNSTCARRRVGAVIIDPNSKEIVSMGWNHSSNGISCEAKFFKEYIQDKYPETLEVQQFLRALQEAPSIAHGYEKYLSTELSLVWESFKIFTKTDDFKKLHREWQDTEVHSELTAILNAYKLGRSVENCILFSSRSPCIACAHAIIESSIHKVYYTQLSEAGKGGIPILEQANIEIEYIDPAPFEEKWYT